MPPKRKLAASDENGASKPKIQAQNPGSTGNSNAIASFHTITEDIRQLHEDLERLERLICEEFRRFFSNSGPTQGNTFNARLFHEYAVLDLLTQVEEKSVKLLGLYEDGRGEREEELEVLKASSAGAGLLKTFDAYVACVNAELGPHDAALVEDYDGIAKRALKRVDEGVLEGRVRGLFSGEEGLGRYFDVEELYAAYRGVEGVYLKSVVRKAGGGGGEADHAYKADDADDADKADDADADGKNGEVSLAEYLVSLGEGHESALSLVFKMKNHGRYVGYLERVVGYLSGLYARSNPLKEYSAAEREIAGAFEAAWEGQIKDRFAALTAGVGASGAPGAKDWEGAYASVDALEKGMDGEEMKVLLASMGLKCGGTVRQRAERLWSVRGKAPGEIDPGLFAGAGSGKKRRGGKKRKSEGEGEGQGEGGGEGQKANGKEGTHPDRPDDTARRIAELEFAVKHLCTTPSLLAKQYKATIEKLEKRHAQTYEEFQADMEAEMEDDVAQNVFANEGDEDERDVHNPLKIPLGVDGKPIPYWMYKLHGLNHEFPCEICGNATYCGRREYEKHFTEPKHVGGLRALGITNSRQFYEITSISEALGLWNAIQGRKKAGGAVEEEVEDAEGNIMSRDMLTQMQMQGLL